MKIFHFSLLLLPINDLNFALHSFLMLRIVFFLGKAASQPLFETLMKNSRLLNDFICIFKFSRAPLIWFNNEDNFYMSLLVCYLQRLVLLFELKVALKLMELLICATERACLSNLIVNKLVN